MNDLMIPPELQTRLAPLHQQALDLTVDSLATCEAAYALAGVGEQELVSGLAGFLRDPAAEVRRAAAEALMWDADSRWPFAREMVKEALADPRLADDGPLFAGAGRLPVAAVADLATWSAEHPPLARRAILTLLLASERSVGELEQELGLSQPSVSKHLKVLRDAGLVESRVEAQKRLYRLVPGPLQELDEWILPFRRFWSKHIDALEKHLDAMDKPPAKGRKKHG